MKAPRPAPVEGSIFLDARRGGRALRVSWHRDSDLVVLSLWRENVCVGSFRLDGADVPALVDLLSSQPFAEPAGESPTAELPAAARPSA